MTYAFQAPFKLRLADTMQYQTAGADTPNLATISSIDGAEMSKTQKEKDGKRRMKAEIVVQHTDIIKDDFWEQRPWLLGGKADG